MCSVMQVAIGERIMCAYASLPQNQTLQPDKAMNSDMQERRFALLLHTGHGERSAFRKVRHMDDASIISELKSLGPKSQEMLSRAGITSVA